MADTKVSGLSAAASFLTTHEFPVNEAGTSKKVTGAQIMVPMAQGTLSGGYVQVTANQGPITTVVDLTSLTVTVTPGTGRRIRITGAVFFQSTVADDGASMSIQEGATVLQSAQVICRVINQSLSCVAIAIIQPTAAAHTYKLTGIRSFGSGNITMAASATIPAFILVEDIGV